MGQTFEEAKEMYKKLEQNAEASRLKRNIMVYKRPEYQKIHYCVKCKSILRFNPFRTVTMCRIACWRCRYK